MCLRLNRSAGRVHWSPSAFKCIIARPRFGRPARAWPVATCGVRTANETGPRPGPTSGTWSRPSLLRAIIFDFDGVIVNSEPLVCQLTRQMAARQGWALSEREYYRTYLALDDRGIVEHLFRTRGHPLDAARRDELIEWKARAYWEAIQGGLPPFPGAVEFVHQAARQFPLAIASGSMRTEIEYLLEKLGLRQAFPVLVAADDVAHSKPDPETYLKALSKLEGLPAFEPTSGHGPLRAAECLVIEDAPGGIEAAHAAGLSCLALAHSCPREELQRADWVYENFAAIDFEKVRSEFP